ncbi:MAG: hypothetical protein ACFFE6_08765 [Candidatus Thorarchaeota archaeon]
MSTIIGNEWNQLYANNPKIQAFAVVKEGAIIWQTENWDLVEDADVIIKAIKEDKSSVIAGGMKYKKASSTVDSYIATADGDKGHLLLVKIDEEIWAIAFAAPHAVPELSIIDVTKSAIQLKGHV